MKWTTLHPVSVSVRVKEKAPPKRDSWADRLLKHQVGGWRAVSAEGLQGTDLHEGLLFVHAPEVPGVIANPGQTTGGCCKFWRPVKPWETAYLRSFPRHFLAGARAARICRDPLYDDSLCPFSDRLPDGFLTASGQLCLFTEVPQISYMFVYAVYMRTCCHNYHTPRHMSTHLPTNVHHEWGISLSLSLYIYIYTCIYIYIIHNYRCDVYAYIRIYIYYIYIYMHTCTYM